MSRQACLGFAILSIGMDELLLALDFGGTKLTAGLTTVGTAVRKEQNWLAYGREFSPADGDANFDIRTMIGLGRGLLKSQKPAAVGVSFGGPVNFAQGIIRLSHHVPGWKNMPLRTILEAEFGCTVHMDNDANVAALGEFQFGAGRGQESLGYITVSTGVGGGFILNGKIWRGAQGMAGEIGHMVVDPSGPLCLCGKLGCVERLASGPYMAQDYLESLASRGKASHGNVSMTGKKLVILAEKGDGLAQHILKRGASALGVGIGNAANLINPSLFVLGGGVTKSGDLWWEILRRSARKTALPEIEVDIVAAELGDDAPLWGAIALTLEAEELDAAGEI